MSQMDKVTQANAEESAAAAQELNGQAEVMKQSVAELVRLVTGSQATSASSVPRDEIRFGGNAADRQAGPTWPWRGCAESQPQQRSQFNGPKPLGRSCG